MTVTNDETVLLQLNQMTVTDTHVHSPVGTFDFAGTQWRWDSTCATDHRQPVWALILGVLTFWTVLGIAFFFVSRSVYRARVVVTMSTPNGAWWSETLLFTTPEERADLEQYLMCLDNWSLTSATARAETGEHAPGWDPLV